jgi:hypothetical protein
MRWRYIDGEREMIDSFDSFDSVRLSASCTAVLKLPPVAEPEDH